MEYVQERLETLREARLRRQLEEEVRSAPVTRLPFNGTLSEDERRMMEQFAFEDWAL